MSKFNSEHDEYLYEGAAVSGVVQGDGTVESPTGWFAAITLQEEGTPGYQPEEGAALKHYGSRWLLIHESNEGFVTVRSFDTEEKREAVYAGLMRIFGRWEVGIADEQVREAIDGYQQAALFASSGEDGTPLDPTLSWSPAAQQRIHDEVSDFITENHEAVADWMKNTGHTWLQVGIDFAFTRNGEGAGFWSRKGAGTAGTFLTEAAVARGEAAVYLGEEGELCLE